MIGLNISSALDSVITIYILIPFLVVPQLLFSGTMVKFDKLNRSISSYEHVPLLGDMMISRWAYEAMAVKQFRDNDYQRIFYYLEKKKSEASYIASYLIPALNSKISRILYAKDESQKAKNVMILQNEMRKLNTKTPKYPFEDVEKITPEYFNSKMAQNIQVYLKKITRYYQQKQNKAINLIDKQIAEMTKEHGKSYLVDLKKDWTNDFLADLMMNRQEIDKIHTTSYGYVRLSDPIYRDPESQIGRAHFYSPVKKIGSLEIDTFWYNMIIIWAFSLLLYFVLLADGLRKLINLASF